MEKIPKGGGHIACGDRHLVHLHCAMHDPISPPYPHLTTLPTPHHPTYTSPPYLHLTTLPTPHHPTHTSPPYPHLTTLPTSHHPTYTSPPYPHLTTLPTPHHPTHTSLPYQPHPHSPNSVNLYLFDVQFIIDLCTLLKHSCEQWKGQHPICT